MSISFHFLFFVLVDEVTKIWKYYIMFVYFFIICLARLALQTENTVKKITQPKVTKIWKNKVTKMKWNKHLTQISTEQSLIRVYLICRALTWLTTITDLSPILSNFFLESRQSQYGHIFCRTELTKQNLSLLPSSEFLSLLLKNLLGNWIILLFVFFLPCFNTL